MERKRRGWLWLTLALALAGCAPWSHGTRAEEGVATVVLDLVDRVVAPGEARPIAWVGVRDGEGKESPESGVLAEYLLSALLERGFAVVVDSTAGGKWRGEEAIPAKIWRGAAAPLVVGGRLERAGEWNYLRLFAIEREGGRLLAAARRPVADEVVQDLVAEQREEREGGEASGALGLELHLLCLRDEGGVARKVEVEEGSTLMPDDRIQLRFRVAEDCQVYAFLYSSEGEREDLFPSQFVYSGRWQYGPSKGGWTTLETADQVHTLYILAGRRLNDEREELWTRMEELIQQGRVERFTGLDLLDRTLVEFLMRDLEKNSPLQVVRGMEGVEKGDLESFILEDGTRVESRGELLEGGPVLIRGISFGVQ